jgi:hypothetical protein
MKLGELMTTWSEVMMKECGENIFEAPIDFLSAPLIYTFPNGEVYEINIQIRQMEEVGE